MVCLWLVLLLPLSVLFVLECILLLYHNVLCNICNNRQFGLKKNILLFYLFLFCFVVNFVKQKHGTFVIYKNCIFYDRA